MLRSSYLWNSQAKLCPAPLSGSLRRPLPAAPLLPLLVSQCHLPAQDPGRCLVFASSATTQRLLQLSHSPFWASGCLRAELGLELAGSVTSYFTCVLSDFSRVVPQGLSFPLWKAGLCQRSSMVHNTESSYPGIQTQV